MRRLSFRVTAALMAMVITLPLTIGVREGQTQPPVSVAAPLVRQGAFAMSLAEALNLGHPASEADAEGMLGAVGIAPRNGWIADYPVTPDIIGELRDSVMYAAQANTLPMDVDTALRTLDSVESSLNVTVAPGPAGPPETYVQGDIAGCPNQNIVNDYYAQEGVPPIMTYCAPPANYYYDYAWVPYPFWWGGFWFGGYFMLNDFHRYYREDGHVFVVSNHFNDVRAHRVFRIDPVNRFNGRTFAGIGAPRSNSFINPGIQRAPQRIFNGNRSFTSPQSTRTVRPQGGATGMARQPSTRSFNANPFHETRVYSRPPGAGRTFTSRPSASGSGRTSAAPSGARGGGGGRGGGGAGKR